jgi:hypothetical protein
MILDSPRAGAAGLKVLKNRAHLPGPFLAIMGRVINCLPPTTSYGIGSGWCRVPGVDLPDEERTEFDDKLRNKKGSGDSFVESRQKGVVAGRELQQMSVRSLPGGLDPGGEMRDVVAIGDECNLQ